MNDLLPSPPFKNPIRQLIIKSCANPPGADKKHKKFSIMLEKAVVEKDERPGKRRLRHRIPLTSGTKA